MPASVQFFVPFFVLWQPLISPIQLQTYFLKLGLHSVSFLELVRLCVLESDRPDHDQVFY